MINVESTWNNQEMKAIWSYLLVLVFLFITQTCTAKQDVCPPWFIPDNSSSTWCSCRSSKEVIKCGTDLQQCDWNNRFRTLSIHCTVQRYFNLDFYIQLPDNVSLLNEFLCEPLNREDKLCRKCKDGFTTAKPWDTMGRVQCNGRVQWKMKRWWNWSSWPIWASVKLRWVMVVDTNAVH